MNKSYTINVSFSSNDWYAEHLSVAIYSLLKNLQKDYFANIYILDWWISELHKNHIKNIVNNSWNWKVEFIIINSEKYKDFPIIWWLSKETYFRLDIPNLLPNIDKIIYLDVDIIVNRSISLLRENKLNFMIWAVREITTINYYPDIYKINSKYQLFFNAWILLMDLKKLKNFNLLDKVKDFLTIYKNDVVACDQDALNVILNNKRDSLSPKYNALPFLRATKTWKYLWYTNEEFKEAKDNPVIIHFAWEKPRNQNCFHPLASLYHKYRAECWLPPIIHWKGMSFTVFLKQTLSRTTLFLQANISNKIYRYLVYKPYRFLFRIK